jgi:hypothetical protein
VHRTVANAAWYTGSESLREDLQTPRIQVEIKRNATKREKGKKNNGALNEG